MIEIRIDSKTGEIRQQNHGTAKQLLIESIGIVQSMYSNMRRNEQPLLRANAKLFRIMLKALMDDDTFWNMEPDESITLNMDPKEAKPQ